MGVLCKLFECNGLEQRIIDFANTGKGAFPLEVSHLTFGHSEMGMRTGYYDVFSAQINDQKTVDIHLPVLTTQKLYARDIPAYVKEALLSCFESHNLECPEARDEQNKDPKA
jgi:S-ribosylhomocysteine lyase LuxS involved in autoinducer biosynthesis